LSPKVKQCLAYLQPFTYVFEETVSKEGYENNLSVFNKCIRKESERDDSINRENVPDIFTGTAIGVPTFPSMGKKCSRCMGPAKNVSIIFKRLPAIKKYLI